MTDHRIDNLARTLVQYSTKVKPGEWVLVYGSMEAQPLIRATLREVLAAGARPTVLIDNDELKETLLRYASDEQIQFVSPFEEMVYSDIDVLIRIKATSNTRMLNSIAPHKIQLYQQARRSMYETYFRRSAEGSLRWVGTHYPCQALAQDADMSLQEFEDFVYAATYADQPDPIARWEAVHDEQQRLVNWLAGKKEVALRGPNVDLRLSVAGRKFINGAGTENMPCGELYTSPVEDSANGWIRFTYPAVNNNREVEGVELEFKDGKVVNATARKNEDYLLAMLDTDERARYLGEFAIGTNFAIQRFTKSIAFDEKIGGSIHLAIGAGFPETGGGNRSSIHWDMICDMRQDSEIYVDGELFYKDGQFQP